MYLDLFEITKGGKMLFSIVSIYMLFTSITLPLIHYYKAKRNAKRYASEVSSSFFFNFFIYIYIIIYLFNYLK